jgi:alkylhydroperoxidase/carboxymuconolactone decarboxylase family protein YurZ/quinol monooxygenase YgiN
MNIATFLKGVLLFVLMIKVNIMQAQENKNLDARQQTIVSIVALTAAGELDQLKMQLNAGLDSGLSINEIKEILVQLYAYCGFPRSLNAITTFMAVLEERKAKGITDVAGKEATQLKDSSRQYERGRMTLEVLTKTTQAKPAPGFGEFVPRIDAFLKEHLFADIFDSDVLTYQQRELATISALAAMTGVQSQLQAHLQMGINTGLTKDQLLQIAVLIEKFINKTQANTVRKLLSAPIVPIVETGMMVRISEIEIFLEHLEIYNAILKEEAAISVKIEPGVIAIFPMYQKENPAQVRIVEMYANQGAYEQHLKTPHFQKYKTTTLKMVKSLNLVDMKSIDTETMQVIFEKLK